MALLPTQFVCEKHFKANDILKVFHVAGLPDTLHRERNKLVDNACPFLESNLPSTIEVIVVLSIYINMYLCTN